MKQWTMFNLRSGCRKSVCSIKIKTVFQKLTGSGVSCRENYWKKIEMAFMNRTLRTAMATEIKFTVVVIIFLNWLIKLDRMPIGLWFQPECWLVTSRATFSIDVFVKYHFCITNTSVCHGWVWVLMNDNIYFPSSGILMMGRSGLFPSCIESCSVDIMHSCKRSKNIHLVLE